VERRAAAGDPRPIGIFDSGVGGLTVVRAIRERLPMEPTIYVADLLHFPYGPRFQDEVRGFAIDIIRYLESRDVKLVVIACNTATAAALNHARELFEGTMRSQEYLHAIKEIDPMVGVYQKACPELVDIVEAGEADSPRAEEVLRRDLDDIVRLGADTLVLGCTHYPLLKPAITRLYPGAFTLVDSATTTAAKVERHLDHSRLRAAGGEPRHEILVTAVPQQFDRIAANIFGDPVRAQEVQLWEKQTT
jgi:glutamate racemase